MPVGYVTFTTLIEVDMFWSEKTYFMVMIFNKMVIRGYVHASVAFTGDKTSSQQTSQALLFNLIRFRGWKLVFQMWLPKQQLKRHLPKLCSESEVWEVWCILVKQFSSSLRLRMWLDASDTQVAKVVVQHFIPFELIFSASRRPCGI